MIERLRTLQRLHYAAAALHAASFVAQLVLCIVFIDRLFPVELSIQKGATAANWTSLGTYAVAWLILSFAPITAGFHVWQARKRVIQQVQRDGANRWRWLEYSITASIMTWAIAQTSSATDVNTLILLVFANVAMQLCGYVMERRNADVEWHLSAPSRAIDWWPFVTGSVLFVGIWYIIGYYFFTAIAYVGASVVPWFVYATFFGLLVQFAGFAIVMAFHYVVPPRLPLCRQTKVRTVASGDVFMYSQEDSYYHLYSKGEDTGLLFELVSGGDQDAPRYRMINRWTKSEDEDVTSGLQSQTLYWTETSRDKYGSVQVKIKKQGTRGWIDLRDPVQYETAWIILSLVSKLYLEWILLGGSIGR
jgi:hypothetical protein